MNSTIISIILWVPFGISVFISGLIFCIGGYRKGYIRALVGFGATVVATALTVLLANLVSMLLSGGSTGSSMTEIVISIVKRPLLSLLFFWLLMPLITIISRIIAGKIVGDRCKASKSWQKWLGLAVGMVCAVAFSLFWLSPLYGSVQMVADVADSVMEATDTEDQEVQSLLDAVIDHPLIVVAKEGPVRWVYQGTAQVGNGMNSFSVTAMIESAEHTITLMTQLANAQTVEEQSQKATELVNYIHTDVVGQEWFYRMYQTALSGVQDTVTAWNEVPVASNEVMMVSPGAVSVIGMGQMGFDSIPEEVKQVLPIIQDALDTLDVDKKTFDTNMENLFGFLSRAMDAGLWTALENGDASILQDSEIVADAGWLANSTQEAVAVKRLLIAAFLMDEDEEALSLLDKYDFGMITDPEQQAQEAELLFNIILGGDCSLSEFVENHPSLGADTLQNLTEEYGLGLLCGLGLYEQDIFDRLTEKDPGLEAYILKSCSKSAENADKPSAAELCKALCYVVALCEQENLCLPDPSAAAVAFAMDYYGEHGPALENPRLSADLMLQVLKAYPKALADYEGQVGEYGGEMEWLAWLLDYMLEQRNASLEDSYELLNYTSWYIDREISTTVVKYLVDTKGDDPLQIRGMFNRNTRDQMKWALEGFVDWYDVVGEYKQKVHMEFAYMEEDGKLYLVNAENVRYEVSDYDDFPEELLPSEEYVKEQKALIKERIQYLIRFLGF